MPTYEIYALKYAGPLTSSGALLMWFRDWETTETRNYYIWVVRGEGRCFVVDTGVAPEDAEKRTINGYVSPVEVLGRIGIDARDVEHVILTHLHWDHIGGVRLFPRARFYVQREEYRFWTSDPIARRPPFRAVADEAACRYLRTLEGSERLALLDGDRQIAPGIECLLAPGHTPALQAVAVATAGGTAILGSDCAHVFRNYREDWPSSLICDLVPWMKTYDKLRQKATRLDLLFPGHDPKMTSDYPEVAPEVTRLV
ncbi:MAG: N-acyl homoserine lactonase family protein [Candidatus Eisenbacteria bacterium]|nr:N-acyl homoserine lactonase family protein [Candidatus Eisenbacteria bacterium]